MQKIILNYDQSTGNVTDDTGAHVGVLTSQPVLANTQSDTTLALVKQGVTVDEIIKLKNADLLS